MSRITGEGRADLFSGQERGGVPTVFIRVVLVLGDGGGGGEGGGGGRLI